MHGKVLSHYRLEEKIGEGGMGVVWRATDLVLGRTVAIKLLPSNLSDDDDRRRRFMDEAKLASSLSHGHVAQVYELGRDGALDFIVMEYVEGRPLARMITGRPLPADQVTALGLQVAEAVSRAHKKGLLHRDLKPSNVMVTDDNEAKVVDFGLATLLEHRDSTLASRLSALTETLESPARGRQEVVGTLPYMSPEQLHGERIDARSDIFSLGTTLYEMTTGRRPFVGTTAADVAREIAAATPAPPHEVVPKTPLDLERIILKALARRPADRYQTMDDLAVDLRRLGRELDSGSTPSFEDLIGSQRGQRQPRAARASRAWKVGGTIAGAVVLAALAWLGWSVVGDRAARAQVSVLVLPLEIRGQETGADYVGQAFSEALALALSQRGAVRVLAVPGPGEVPAQTKERTRYASALGATRLVAGSIVRQGESVRASVNLIEVGSNRIVWGAQQEAPGGDLQILASTIAAQTLRAMNVAMARLYTTSEEYEGTPDLVRSLDWNTALGALARSDFEDAVAATKRLVRAFPDEPEAWVLRTQSLIALGRPSNDPEIKREALAALDRVEELDPEHPRLPHWRADIPRMWDDIWNEDAIAPILERQDLSPALRASVLWTRSYVEQSTAALATVEEALRLQPASAALLMKASAVLLVDGRLDEAETRARQALALDPLNPYGYSQLGWVLEARGDYDGALENWKMAHEKLPSPATALDLARINSRLGNKGEMSKYLDEFRRHPGAEKTNLHYNLACFYVVTGDREEALRELAIAVENGFGTFMLRDPDLVPLHGDARFEKLAEVVKRRADSRTTAAP